MINIIIPMAGKGSRFANAGYALPKPLIDVNNQTMIELVIKNLKPAMDHKFIFICQKEHLENFPLREILVNKAGDCVIIELEGITDGAASTVLCAKKYFDNEDQLMIANCDQYVDIDINHYLQCMNNKAYDGLIMTMKSNEDKWSYVKYDSNNIVNNVVEKKVISDEATVGIYNYLYGRDFVKSAEEMIRKNLRVNNEFYVAPVYNEMIKEGKKITYYNIGKVDDGMYGLGTPEDLEKYLQKYK